MPTKKIGYFLTIVGALAFLTSALMDFVIPGDTGIGASQILGMESGVAILLLGLFWAFLYPNTEIKIASTLKSVVQRVLNLPVSVWVVVGFAVIYVAFYLSPVFFNADRSMWYFNRYIPDKNPIGVDVQDNVRYIENWLVSGQSPIADGFIAYPPLAFAIFSPLVLIGYPAIFYFMTFATLFFHLGSALVVLPFVKKHQNVSLALLIFGLSIFSYGFQFELERGQFNVIAFSLALIAIYIFHSRYEYRYIAYLLFTLGVQLKIYPVLLIVMFIRDWRDWKSNLKRLASIALLNFALLFVLGWQIFVDFLRAVAGKQTFGATWNGNHSLKGFVNQLVQDGYGLFQPATLTAFQEFQGSIELFFLAVIGFCFLAVLVHSYIQNNSQPNPLLLLSATICALVLPSLSNDYKLPILTAPIAAVFCGIALPEHQWRKILSILLILIMSMAYWSMQYPFSVKPDLLTRNFPALFVLLIAATVLNFVASSKRSTVPVEQVQAEYQTYQKDQVTQ